MVPERGRILIIDDEVDLADVYGQILSADHDVVVMTDSRKAFELLKRDQNFDIIFSDITMPGMSGMDIYNELRRTGTSIEKRIVFITGGIFTLGAKEFLQNVSNICIDKPIELKALRSLAKELVQQQKGKLFKNGA